MRRQRMRLACLLLAVTVCLPCISCAYLYPEPDENDAEFTSDTVDYARRAKEYFDGGDYARARDQLQKYLKGDPSNWMVRLQMHYCDYYQGIERLAARNIEGGRELFRRGEAGLREMWDGKLEASTEDTALEPVQPWKAAMGIAMVQRGLGWADNLEAERKKRQLKSLKFDDPGRAGMVRDINALEQRRDQNYQASANLFERVCAMKSAPPEAIKNLAELRIVQKQDDEAEKLLLEYLKLADETYAANKKLEGQLEKAFPVASSRAVAESLLEEKLESNSTKRMEVLRDLGHLAYQADQYQKALGYLERAHEIRPDRLDILLKMGQCLGESGKFKEAVENLDAYIVKRSERNDRFDEDIAMAYRLKAKYARRLERADR